MAATGADSTGSVVLPGAAVSVRAGADDWLGLGAVSAARVAAGAGAGAGAGATGWSKPGGSSDSGRSCASTGSAAPASRSAAKAVRESLVREIFKRNHLLDARGLLGGSSAGEEEHRANQQHQ